MKPVSILMTISEPWEFGESLGWPRIRGDIVAIEPGQVPDRALVRFATPVVHRGISYPSAIVSPRLAGTLISSVLTGSVVGASVICSTADLPATDTVPDTKAWRGGLAFVADLQCNVTK